MEINIKINLHQVITSYDLMSTMNQLAPSGWIVADSSTYPFMKGQPTGASLFQEVPKLKRFNCLFIFHMCVLVPFLFGQLLLVRHPKVPSNCPILKLLSYFLSSSYFVWFILDVIILHNINNWGVYFSLEQHVVGLSTKLKCDHNIMKTSSLSIS